MVVDCVNLVYILRFIFYFIVSDSGFYDFNIVMILIF